MKYHAVLRLLSIAKSYRDVINVAKKWTTDSREGVMVKDVINVEYHRNGISGESFYTVIFSGDFGAEENVVLMATLFEYDVEEDEGTFAGSNPFCAVVRVDEVGCKRIESNWRGDQFSPFIEAVVRIYSNKK
jgi:hypothetical protein